MVSEGGKKRERELKSTSDSLLSFSRISLWFECRISKVPSVFHVCENMSVLRNEVYILKN